MYGGVWWGMYETDDKKEQKALDKIEWIIKITKEEYDGELKKKRQNTSDFSPLPQGGRPKQVAIQGEGVEAVQRDPQDSSGEAKTELTVDEITKPALVKGSKKRLKRSK